MACKQSTPDQTVRPVEKNFSNFNCHCWILKRYEVEFQNARRKNKSEKKNSVINLFQTIKVNTLFIS